MTRRPHKVSLRLSNIEHERLHWLIKRRVAGAHRGTPSEVIRFALARLAEETVDDEKILGVRPRSASDKQSRKKP